MEKQLRNYQSECLEIIKKLSPGKYLICMATGMGKTFTFSRLEDIYKGRILILSHREELVVQPRKYFKSIMGREQGKYKSSGQRIISACVSSLVNRLDRFSAFDFEIIIVDEAHHTPAPSYQKIINYFHGAKFIFGFTATPNRGDKIGLDKCYDKIIFQKDLKWGIQNNYLCDIECKRVDIGIKTSGLKTRAGDFEQKQLEIAVNIERANDTIAEIYHTMSRGKTLIFAVSVNHCYEIQKRIEGSSVIDGKTKERDRKAILNNFQFGDCNCLINCMVLTEGTDLPCISTIIWARPTKNNSLYIQGVGRGLRLYEGKEKLLLIDCVGSINDIDLCTAPSLLGLKMENVPKNKEKEIEGNIFDLEEKIIESSDIPETWIKNIKIVDIWGKKNNINTHGVNYLKMPNGDFVLSIPKIKFTIKAQDEMGNTIYKGKKVPIQDIFDKAYDYLCNNHSEDRMLWDINSIKRWGTKPATDKQKGIIKRRLKNFDPENLNCMEASLVLNRILNK